MTATKVCNCGIIAMPARIQTTIPDIDYINYKLINLLLKRSLISGASESTEHDHHISSVLRGVVPIEQQCVVYIITLAKTHAENMTAEILWDPGKRIIDILIK